MIVKQTETSYSVREVCRNCHGKGHKLRLVDDGHDGLNPVDDKCEVCHGRGIVEKLTEVRITISTVDEEGGSHEG